MDGLLIEHLINILILYLNLLICVDWLFMVSFKQKFGTLSFLHSVDFWHTSRLLSCTGCGLWETDGRRSLHGLGTFRRTLGRGEAVGISSCALWRIRCQCLFFESTPGWLPLNHSAFLKLCGCVFVRTRLRTLIQQTASRMHIWNMSNAIITIVGDPKSSQLFHYSPILSHNYHDFPISIHVIYSPNSPYNYGPHEPGRAMICPFKYWCSIAMSYVVDQGLNPMTSHDDLYHFIIFYRYK